MTRFVLRNLAWAALALAITQAPAPPTSRTRPKALEFFENPNPPRPRPVLQVPQPAESQKLKGDLLVELCAGLLKGGASKKPAIAPGEPEKSPLIHAPRRRPRFGHAPQGRRPHQAQIADFVAWVKMGAAGPAR